MISPSSTTRRGLAFSGILSGIALALLSLPRLSTAAEEDAERAQLAAIVRQLDQLQRQAEHASALAPQERRRYHLDYPRLQADLQRVRSGLQDYLAPVRAQPRDVQPLSASYRTEDTSGPDDMNDPGQVRGSTAKPLPQQVGSKP